MKDYRCIFIGLLFIIIGCNDSSFIEDVGPSKGSDDPSGGGKTGSITLYCTNYNMATGCGALDVYVNSEYKGEILEMSGSRSSCGGSGSQILSLILPEGTHNFSITSRVSNCLRYTFSTTVKNGYCTLYELQ